jgi:Acetyltransferase (GNAT) family
VWGRGLGRALLRDVTAELAGLGYREAALWVVPQNDRALRFYESEQWRDDHVRRDDEVFGVVVREMRYRRRLPTSGPGVSATRRAKRPLVASTNAGHSSDDMPFDVRRVRLNAAFCGRVRYVLSLTRQGR